MLPLKAREVTLELAKLLFSGPVVVLVLALVFRKPITAWLDRKGR